MFKKALIANRGEIACRVIETCRRMGIRTVAVYSQADSSARHVRLADEAVFIGPAPARDSYLRGDKIIAAAEQTKAEAIHPGYGFLSENAEFASACVSKGISFIGPPARAIRAMGSKSAAKKFMESAKVPLVPGYHGPNQDPEFLRKHAKNIGYPVLIKASAGGGGKGMRIVESDGDFATALASCRREAASSFGDESVLVEKYLFRARHIEIQIFADSHGNVVSLFERDCSAQRLHQKILEEAPAPDITEELRSEMSLTACDAARAVGYVGAGTVEFIVSQDGAFYFMEMNTRLQVEHPVTEMITGLDLVEWQFRVAAGEQLPLSQSELKISGHAMEARIYAEDPDRGFLPSTGRLVHLAIPARTANVRFDTGVEAGDEITPYYDPMIAKLIVWDQNREQARVRLLTALRQIQIVGVANNVEFLGRLIASTVFAEANLDTGLIDREREYFLGGTQSVTEDVFSLAALRELLFEAQWERTHTVSKSEPHSAWNMRDGWRLNAKLTRVLKFRTGAEEKTVRVSYAGNLFILEYEGATSKARGELGSDGTLVAELGFRRLKAQIVAVGNCRHVFFDGRRYVLSLVDRLQIPANNIRSEGHFTAPMPGKIIALLAEAGREIEIGAPILILEAMKMEHTITSPRSGILKAFRYSVGDQVAEGAELVEFEP